MPKKKTRPRVSARRAAYKAYLCSAAWKAFRKLILDARGNHCEKCLSPKRLHVHHLTYARFGHELPEDVQVLCSRCHAAEHPNKSFPRKRRKVSPLRQAFRDLLKAA